jgi:hypothetical protein
MFSFCWDIGTTIVFILATPALQQSKERKHYPSILKVDSNEKLGAPERYSNEPLVWHCGDRNLFAI